MMYLNKNIDGSIGIITLFPIKIIRKNDNVEIIVLGQKRKQDRCIIYGFIELDNKNVEIVVGDENFNIADLEEDTLSEYTIVFPDVKKDIIGKWIKSSRDAVVSIRKLNKEEVPNDRTFRDSWQDEGNNISHNMNKAKEIHLKRLRERRNYLLSEKDKEWMKAVGQENKTEADKIEAERQALRDFPEILKPDLDAAKTIEELKLITLK